VAVALAVGTGGAGALIWHLAGGQAVRGSAARVEARVDGPLRPDGSAEPGRVWRLAFEGAELRVYRNGLRWGERCPGGSGCTGGPRQELRLPLDGAGEYRAAAFSPGPGDDGATLRDDVTRARTRGVAVALSDPLIVY
jgi:hypothetical protein